MSMVAKLAIGIAAIFTIVALALIAKPADAVTIDRDPDCDKYAVIYCGSYTKKEVLKKMNNGDGRNSASNIKGIFKQFSITTSRIESDTFVKGVVYKNGNVKVGDVIVATNAQTYIRTLGGKGSTSRMGSAQEALVHINNKGVFEYAIMTPCGNPVTGKPVEPPKPETISCDAIKVNIVSSKERKVEAKVTGSAKNTKITGYKIEFGDGSSANKQSATHTYAKYGKYTITGYVKGKVKGDTKTVTSKPCTYVVEFKKPPKPKEQVITCDALKLVIDHETRSVKAIVNGSAQNTKITGYKIDFDDGTVVNKQTASHTYAKYGTYTITAHVIGTVDGKKVSVNGPQCQQTVTFKEPPKPESITCDALKVTIVDKKNRQVEAKVMGSANNTEITGYKIDFDDGTVVNEQTATHTYDNYGIYTIMAHVSGVVDGKEVSVNGPDCKKQVEFKEPPKPQEQAIECDALNLLGYNKETRYVKVSVDGTATNTAIDGYKIDFGDGTTVDQQESEHTYAGYGEYDIKVYVNGVVNEEPVVVGGSGNCIQTVSFSEEITPCPTNPALPIDDPNCKPCEYDSSLNYDDPECKKPDEPVAPEIPNTGAGALIGFFSGASILGAVGHRMRFLNKN